MKRHLLIALALVLGAGLGANAATERFTLNLSQWQFSHNDTAWQQVTVPHDWAISGPFDKKWDLQNVAIEQNGETEKTEKSGRSGALPWIGQGTYRTTFVMPRGYERCVLNFDGAMAEPEVWVNGQLAGGWKYGYNCFRVEATPYVKAGRPNHVEVRLKNVEESNRWYPGGGLYRPVTVTFTGDERLDEWGTFIRTTSIADGEATLAVSVKAQGLKRGKRYVALVELTDATGRTVATTRPVLGPQGTGAAVVKLAAPELWTPERPYLYHARITMLADGKRVDSQQLRVGVRTVSFSREGGFQLNGVTRKIKGVCLHHDLGPLGAAVNEAALTRQIKIMKEMGADAIRTSHNMPSQMQMDLCDSLGMMVMAESFDGWAVPKVKNGYNRFWSEWWQRDITNLVLANRNHPSVIMWSVGNEIPEQHTALGAARTDSLTQLCHRLDPTRTVTCGMDHAESALQSGYMQALDVPGFNYRVHLYDTLLPSIPQGFILGSETASALSSRGVYHFPVEVVTNKEYPDGQCSSYDTEYCWWSNEPDDDWRHQDDNPQVVGEFVWTGFDYLGEPTPYDTYWPSRSSYFGICDLAGLPKDRYYLYRSHWNKTSHTLHLLPHWTWPGREGQVTPVYCYTDYNTAELFVNGKSQGRITKNPDSRFDRYRLRWNDVTYEPGELRVVAYDDNGNAAAERTVRTAGAPARLQLVADRDTIKADGQDISFVAVSMTDESGTLCPAADHQLEFTVTGAAAYKAACNGDATSLEPFTQPTMRLFSGQLVVLVQAGTQAGEAILTVRTADGAIQAQLPITVQ